MAGTLKVEAVHAATGKSFAEIERECATAAEPQPGREAGVTEEVA